MKKLSNTRSTAGFTLVELAIVMIIVGLLIGGILKGQELIQSARITRTMGDIHAFKAATMTFQDSYGGLPGDLRNPAIVLPKCATMPACVAAGGNSDFHIGTWQVSNWSHDNQSGTNTEPTQFWVHLVAADLVSGTSANGAQVWGDLYPPSPMGGGYQVANVLETGVNQATGHYMILRLQPTGDPHPVNIGDTVLDPVTLSTMDRKYDDGLPNTGDIIADDAAGRCFNATTFQYVPSSSNKICLGAFRFY